MSRLCQLCGKGYQRAKIVPRGVGNRVTKRSIKKRMVNLRSKRFEINGSFVKLIICSSCLKRIKMDSVHFKQQIRWLLYNRL
jgi:ribosomal protein L28